MELCLGLVGLKTTLKTVERLARPPKPRAINHETAERIVALAFRGHPFLRGRCLARAMLQYALHRTEGTAARLVVGDRRDAPESIAGHAWVEPLDATGTRPHTPVFSSEFRP